MKKLAVEKMKLRVEIVVDGNRVQDLLCSAFEGGIGYWARVVGYQEPRKPDPKPRLHSDGVTPWPRYCRYPLLDGAGVWVQEISDNGGFSVRSKKIQPATYPDNYLGGSAPGMTHLLDRKAIQRGLTLMQQKEPRHFANWLQENDDAETGDVFVQLAILGEIVYG